MRSHRSRQHPKKLKTVSTPFSPTLSTLSSTDVSIVSPTFRASSLARGPGTTPDVTTSKKRKCSELSVVATASLTSVAWGASATAAATATETDLLTPEFDQLFPAGFPLTPLSMDAPVVPLPSSMPSPLTPLTVDTTLSTTSTSSPSASFVEQKLAPPICFDLKNSSVSTPKLKQLAELDLGQELTVHLRDDIVRGHIIHIQLQKFLLLNSSHDPVCATPIRSLSDLTACAGRSQVWIDSKYDPKAHFRFSQPVSFEAGRRVVYDVIFHLELADVDAS